MGKYLLGSALVILMAGSSLGQAFDEGMVADLTLDAVTIDKGGAVKQTYLLSNEIMGNCVHSGGPFSGTRGVPIRNIKKGQKVTIDLGYWTKERGFICIAIHLFTPSDAGIVTAVGKDTITIRNDNGKSMVYTVSDALVNNSLPNLSACYPSRFSEVKVDCRIEIITYEDHDKMVICSIDVKKKDKGK